MNHTLETSPVAGQENSAAPDCAAIKQRQQTVWASGDFATIGVTLQMVRESLAEAADIGAGEQVLDVAAGNGNATLAAAHRFAPVTSTDFVPALLVKGRQRAAAEGSAVDFQMADAEHLPFGDGSFDAVLFTFGVMFTPDQDRSAQEMLRGVRAGASVWPTRPPRVSSGSCSRPWGAMCRHPPVSDRLRSGAPKPIWPNPLGRRLRASGQSASTSTSVTAPPPTGCRFSATFTGQ